MTVIVERLPDDPLFRRISEAFTNHPDYVLVKDWKKGSEATCMQLLVDMLYLRRQIVQHLPDGMFDFRQRINQERPYILILAPGNYDFIVAAYGALCSCAAFSTLATDLTPEEAYHFLELTNASCILCSPEFQEQALSFQQYQASQKNGYNSVTIIPIETHRCLTARPQIKLDPEMSIDARSPGVLAFTSGTTGPPKGIIRPRSLWYSKLEPFPSGGVALTYRASSRTGSSIPMIWRAMNGTRSDVINDDPGNIWERLRAGDVTYISCAPSGWARNMRYFNEHIDVLPAEERQQYVKGVRALQTPISAGEFTPHGVANFWQDLLGRPLLDMYGSTEMGVVWSRKIVSESGTERVGALRKHVEMKLSEGDRGEILVKSPTMFTGYLRNEAATRAAFDEEGYYRTGDAGRRVGDQYINEGRLSTDFIRIFGLWIPLRDVEKHLAGLPYISEVCVVPVEFESAQHIAALVRPISMKPSITLSKIRGDLQSELQTHKLPTLLRTLKDDEHMINPSSGKVMRSQIPSKFFALSTKENLPLEVEFCDGVTPSVDGP